MASVARRRQAKEKEKVGFSILIVPLYHGKIKRITITRFKLYTILTGLFLIVFLTVYVFSSNLYLRSIALQYKGTSLDKVVKLQEEQLRVANTELEKVNKELSALREYVSYLSKLDDQVRSLLRIKNVKLSLTDVLKQKQAPTLTVSRGIATTVKSIGDAGAALQKEAEEREKNLIVLQNAAEEYNEMVAKTPSLWPVWGLVTSSYGWRKNPFGGSSYEMHTGIDIAAPYGTPIRAVAKGKVVFSGWDGRYGLTIKIYHRDGIETIYAHLSKVLVKDGQEIIKGQVIGYMGASGRATGPHLHYEVRIWDKHVSPNPYLD